jgi:hypothetical protein
VALELGLPEDSNIVRQLGSNSTASTMQTTIERTGALLSSSMWRVLVPSSRIRTVSRWLGDLVVLSPSSEEMETMWQEIVSFKPKCAG